MEINNIIKVFFNKIISSNVFLISNAIANYCRGEQCSPVFYVSYNLILVQ